jgi:HEAT repeat protein
MIRQRSLASRPATVITAPAAGGPGASLSVLQRNEQAKSPRGARLEAVVTEVEPRPGESALDALSNAAVSASDPKNKQQARDQLVRFLTRQGPNEIKQRLKDDRPEVRRAAARAVGLKGLRFGDELIGLLRDENADVRLAARQALARLARGEDFGPDVNAGEAERDQAIRLWRAWWAKQGGRGP